jgi:hypothetical protein
LPDHRLRDRLVASAEGGDPGVEVEARQGRLELLDRGEVVGLEDVASLRPLPVALRDPGLQREDSGSGARGVWPFGQGQDVLEVGEVLLSDLGELLLAVVALVRQTDATLQHVDDVAVGVAVVGVDVRPEQAATAASLERTEEGAEL